MTRYEKKLSFLEKEAYMNNIINSFILSEKETNTETYKNNLVTYLKEGFPLGITNDELNTKLISFIEEAINNTQLTYDRSKKSPKNWTKYLYIAENGCIEFQKKFCREDLLAIHTRRLSFLNDQLKKYKENPVDFTKFLDELA